MKKSKNLILIIIMYSLLISNVNARNLHINNNPPTGDDILMYVGILIFGLIGLGVALTTIFVKKKGTK